ncbi:hypothetical protein DSM106972_069430 [Dulcicalothrix desertica PCC 7102]|uniref:Uncharacterized protein n=1 Tax=Dulcicalothrix desertica PCC 7102 TaxID=232991 RepID=A0A433V5L6_9CYAN|nr:hypothetical protein [Dulcicalothrix desertica]RUT01392.1 hypothetical protein DSM106972_069430 [Dulcicalothrix desertica PCC 7102]TWH40462.1 hypothetical protein CAL7102_09794 [Dulcicalothrix desertica PCC 7102]
MLKRFLWFGGGAFGIILIVLVVIWNKATYLPSWYAESVPTQSVTPVDETKPKELTREEIWSKVSSTLQKQASAGERVGKIELKADEVNRLIFSEMQVKEKVTSDAKLEQIIVGKNTQFRDGKLVIGAVINLQELTQHKELQGGRGDLAQAFLNLPIVKDRPVYIEVEGTPIVKNQKIGLDSPSIKLANVSMTVEELSKHLGISQEFINQRISRERALVPMSVQDVKIQGDTISIRGTGTAW